jgi:hypothetical protein
MNLTFFRFLLLATLLAGIFPVYAQINSPLSFELNSIRPGSEINSLGSFHLAVPLYISEKNQFAFSPQYRFLNTGNTFPMNDRHFSQLSTRFAWRHKLSEKWSSALLASSSLASANKNFPSSGLMWFSGVRLAHIQNPSFLYYFGLAYSYRFSNHIIVPLLGFKWKPASGLIIAGDLPFRAQLQLEPNLKITTGLLFRGERFTAHISDTPKSDYFWFRERNIGWEGSIKTFRNFWLTTEIGYSLKRDFNIYTEPETPKWSFATQFIRPEEGAVFEYNENGFYVKFGIKYRFNN